MMLPPLPGYGDEYFEKAHSQFFRVVWTIIFMALAIGLFGDFFYGTAEAGVFPRALFWIVIAPLWLTYLVHKANELDAIFDELHDQNRSSSYHDCGLMPRG